MGKYIFFITSTAKFNKIKTYAVQKILFFIAKTSLSKTRKRIISISIITFL